MWYDILIIPEYVNFFNTFPINVRDDRFDSFRNIIMGITIAKDGSFNDKLFSIYSERINPLQVASVLFVQNAQKGEAIHIGRLIRESRDKIFMARLLNDYSRFSEEELAAWIVYPFWSRMGGSFEIDSAEGGELGALLLELQKKRYQKTDKNQGKINQEK